MNWIVCNCVDEWSSTFNNKTSTFDRRRAHFFMPFSLGVQTLHEHDDRTKHTGIWFKPFFNIVVVVVVIVIATIDDDDDGSGDRRTARRETRSFLKFNVCLWVCLMHTHTHRTNHSSKSTIARAHTQTHTHTDTDNPQIHDDDDDDLFCCCVNAYVSHIWAFLNTTKTHFWHIPIDAISLCRRSLMFCIQNFAYDFCYFASFVVVVIVVFFFVHWQTMWMRFFEQPTWNGEENPIASIVYLFLCRQTKVHHHRTHTDDKIGCVSFWFNCYLHRQTAIPKTKYDCKIEIICTINLTKELKAYCSENRI